MASMFPVTQPYAPARSPPSRARPRHEQPVDSGDLPADLVAHLPALHAYARKLTRDLTRSEDLVQDVAVRALAGASQFAPGTNLRAWLFTILRNAYFSDFRKRRRLDGGAVEDLPEARLAVPATQHHVLEMKGVLRLLLKLPADQRAALLLVAVGGLDYIEASAIAKCSVGTVKSRVHRARLKLTALADAPPAYRPRPQISRVKPYRRAVVIDFTVPSDFVGPMLLCTPAHPTIVASMSPIYGRGIDPMDRLQTHPSAHCHIFAVFERSVRSFDLPHDASLADLASKLAELAERYEERLIRIELTSKARARAKTRLH